MSNRSTASSNESSPSNSISLIKLDELSSFGATKQSRLPALIKLNTVDQNKPINQQPVTINSMPDFRESELEKSTNDKQQRSLPIHLTSSQRETSEHRAGEMAAEVSHQSTGKENVVATEPQENESDDFQVVDMQQEESTGVLIGPSLPYMPAGAGKMQEKLDKSINALQSSLQLGQTTQLGDSLIEMIINLRNENQNLIRALETNNEYVKERLSEFKVVQEDSKKRELQFANEKAEFEHQIRKLQRQNSVLSERLKSMESKLKDMKLQVSESLNAAGSSKASSVRGEHENLYPLIDVDNESFSNEALTKAAEADGAQEATTMQVDVTSDELLNEGDQHRSASLRMDTNHGAQPAAPNFSAMSKDELSKHFDAKKVEFYSIDDPMKQCDTLEQQLNDIGKRDYEICMLQQQLNIYRQDFRLERMEKLEAKIQIEKLKNDIDRLCLERLQSIGDSGVEHQDLPEHYQQGRRISDGLGRLGHRLTKKAARQAAKAAKYAAKQAHLEEKAAAALARVAAARAGPAGQPQPAAQAPQQTIPKAGYAAPDLETHYQSRHNSRYHSSGGRTQRPSGLRSEVVNDLLSTANKAVLTGYKMASTHVNLALDKLSQYEQQQASHLEKNKQQAARANTAPSAPMEPPSID